MMNKKPIDTKELIKLDTCPVTGLPILCKKSWQNIIFTPTYKASFAIIGENILLTIPEGDAGKEGKKLFLAKRNEILKEMNLYEKAHYEIKDYQYVNVIVGPVARKEFTNHMVVENERGFLKGFVGINAPKTFNFMLKFGSYLFRHKKQIPMSMTCCYSTGILSFIKHDEQDKDVIANAQNKLSYQDDVYKIDFFLIDDNIIYNIAEGELREPQAEIFKREFTKFLKMTDLWGKEYYRIVNWDGLKYSSSAAKKLYIKNLNELNKHNKLMKTAVFNVSPFMKMVLKMSSPFVDFEVSVCKNFDEALKVIKEDKYKKEDQKVAKKKKINTYTQTELDQYTDEIINQIKNINWFSRISQDNASSDEVPLNKDNPLEIIYHAVSILKMDLEHSLKDQLEAEKKIALSNKLATIGELAAGVAHEINNPLTIMMGHCDDLQYMLENQGNELSFSEINEAIKKISESGKRIQKIVNALKVQARKSSGTKEPFLIFQNTLDAIESAKNLFPKSQITFELIISDSIKNIVNKIFILGESDKMHQVLLNLFTNSKDSIVEKFQDHKGEGIIKVSFFNSGTYPQHICLSISDNGNGIPDELKHKIFDSFFTTKPIGKGTGLGLSISHAIITEMNGHIEVFSEAGIGTEFKIHLPEYKKDKD